MDNEYDQSKVAYGTGPKEVATKHRMPNSEEQTGKGTKMPQDGGVKIKHAKMIHPHHRHQEHR